MKQYLLGILLAVAACLGASQPALAQEKKDIVDRLETALGVSLPSPYRSQFKEFVATNKIMCDEGSNAFTEQFIKDQMKANLGIKKQNQFLLVWNAIYHAIKNDFIYDGSDGNEALLDDYSKVMDAIDACEAKYRKDYIAYTKQISAEARQQSIILSYHGLYQYIRFYSLRNAALESEIKTMKELFKKDIKDYKEFNIDYQSLLPVEVQKFYGIEPVQQNSITCDKAKANILNIILRETVKLYNLYQQAPQAERKMPDIKGYIKDCKENNIDYRAVLRKELGDEKKVNELLKFFGIE